MPRSALLLSLLVLAACGGDGDTEKAATPTPAAHVESLDNMLALRSAFEADAGKTRVLLLFSPT